MCGHILNLRKRQEGLDNIVHKFVKLKRSELESLKAQLKERNDELESVEAGTSTVSNTSVPGNPGNASSEEGMPPLSATGANTKILVQDDDISRSRRLFQKPTLLQKGENELWYYVRSAWSKQPSTSSAAIVGPTCCCSCFSRFFAKDLGCFVACPRCVYFGPEFYGGRGVYVLFRQEYAEVPLTYYSVRWLIGFSSIGFAVLMLFVVLSVITSIRSRRKRKLKKSDAHSASPPPAASISASKLAMLDSDGYFHEYVNASIWSDYNAKKTQPSMSNSEASTTLHDIVTATKNISSTQNADTGQNSRKTEVNVLKETSKRHMGESNSMYAQNYAKLQGFSIATHPEHYPSSINGDGEQSFNELHSSRVFYLHSHLPADENTGHQPVEGIVSSSSHQQNIRQILFMQIYKIYADTQGYIKK